MLSQLWADCQRTTIGFKPNTRNRVQNYFTCYISKCNRIIKADDTGNVCVCASSYVLLKNVTKNMNISILQIILPDQVISQFTKQAERGAKINLIKLGKHTVMYLPKYFI